MLLNEIRPRRELAEFVRLYRIIDFHFPANITIPDKAYTPRPEHCLQFQPTTASDVFYPGKNGARHNMRVPVLFGQQTVLQYRRVPKEVLSIQVVLQPWTLFRWFGISTQELSNKIIDADCLFNKDIHLVNEQLASAANYEAMIAIVEQYLLRQAGRNRKELHPIDHVMSNFLRLQVPGIEVMASQACLSYRQFDRKFIERTGISPKEYFRVARFDQTYRVKNRFPELDWLSVAMKFGYYDYQHLVRDYKYFTGMTPPELMRNEHAPEKLLGDAET